MKQFSELGIASTKSFEGNRVYIENILGKEIEVDYFQIKPSKKNDGSNCLHIQIKMGDNKHVIFSGSTFLMDQIKQLKTEDFPFKATLIKVNRHYEFS